MLNKLSSKYQKDIALSFISLFFISGLASAKAINIADYNLNHNKFSITQHTLIVNSNRSSKSKLAIFSANDWRESKRKIINLHNNNSINSHLSVLNNESFIGGPSQPEMSAFKSAGADNMVSLFSGDFSYNIPLLDVGGYPINIFYNSGITMDQEASWVGLGWNINPGTINRTMRGLPDDFNGSDKIIKTQSMRPDQTWGVNVGGGVEFAGLGFGVDVNTGMSFNNRLGVATEYGVSSSMSLAAKAGDGKTASLNYSVGLNLSSRSGASVTPSIGLSYSNLSSLKGGSLSASLGYNSRMGLTNLHVSAEAHGMYENEKKAEANKTLDQDHQLNTNTSKSATIEGNFSFAYPSVTPTINMALTRMSFNANFKLGFEAFALLPHANISGFYSKAYIANDDKIKTMPAYGMLYLQKGNDDANALLDFNRIQDGVFTKTSPSIGMPTYSYDVYSISGEGVGGSFRAYRGDLGFVHDPSVSTRDDAGSLGAEFGFGNQFHAGGNLQYVYTPTTAGAWEVGNLAKKSFAFKNSKESYQSVYFKNPGEKTIPDVAYQNAIGGESLVRLQLNAGASGTAILAPTLEKINASNNAVSGINPILNLQKGRDKRTQVITSLTAEEAARVALDTAIFSYNASNTSKVIMGSCAGNTDIVRIDRQSDYRKSHHISEINVLEGDGRKYVYGIPVYNIKQVDVTMSIGNGNNETQQSTYVAADNSTENQQGKDWYYEKQEIPPYAHSFLLTALISPNYVDVKGDGITEDDMGDAIKFNYSKSADVFKWRTPTNNASYSEGLKTTPNDDKAHYVYGEREQWYLYTIESKNMVARFYVDKSRSDGKSVMDQSGGGLANTGNQQLSKIALFSKGDLVKYGTNAKAIKTVYFVYSNKLCPDPNHLTNNGTNANNETGKLTLEGIYFTYNGNEKQRKNKYTFQYAAYNPNYSYTDNDRWGNYKPKKDGTLENNPGGVSDAKYLSNADYPYAIQDKTKADVYVQAWTMNSVTLPSGGKIDVSFESDDYGFVQNRRAANMTKIVGFGAKNNPAGVEITNPTIYGSAAALGLPLTGINSSNPLVECNYIYLQLPVAIKATGVAAKNEFAARYLADVKQLFLKLAINMPPDDNGANTGIELVPMYADLDETADYGLIPGTTDKAFIKVKLLESGNTPMVQYAFSFMKNFLPQKAYKGFDVSETGGLKSVLLALAGMFDSFTELTLGEDGKFMSGKKCMIVQTDKSFMRLSNPAGIKLGGGLRVKRVEISDNWNKMTGQYTSTYGQEYKYTTTELINNIPTTVSSGVASWEPVIGGEENPHREIIKNLNRNKLGPFDYGATELPMGEMFYPNPSVGYSRVEVNSIHRDAVKNPPTKTVTEYFTTKEFPFKSSFSALDGAGKVDYEASPILKILHIDVMHRTTVSQGFKVEINDMNGREKSTATYSTLDPDNAITKSANYYNTVQLTDKSYTFNHQFKTIDKPDGIINPNGIIGRDIEVMSDFREHQSKTYTANLTLNLDFFWIGWFPVPLFNPLSPFYVEENTYRSAAITKIVNHYAMLDSTVVVSKGSTVSTKNLVYDSETGNVLLTRTNNEFNKPVYNFNYPAHWAYSGMGPAYKNIDINFESLVFRKGILETPIQMAAFESGDEIYVWSATSNGPTKNGICDAVDCINPYLVKNNANRIWAINTGKSEANAHWIFMDREGQPYTADLVKMRIIRSGHRNMLSQSVGNIISMNSPIVKDISTGIEQLSFTDATKILTTGVATFKDKWRVDNSLYKSVSSNSDTLPAKYTPPAFTVCRGDTIPQYGSCGSFIYSSYNTEGTQLQRTIIDKSNPFWIGFTSAQNNYCNYSPATSLNNSAARQSAKKMVSDSSSNAQQKSSLNSATTVAGPLNRCGIWACASESSSNGRWLGFSTTITAASTKTYYIGMGADNDYRFKIDGVIFRQDSSGNQENFKLWHIYPQTLTAGTHTIEMEGSNQGSYASFGAEIYDNTETEIRNATHYQNVNNPNDINCVKVLFSTKDMIGQSFETGVYSCAIPGYALNTSSHNPVQYNCIKKGVSTEVCLTTFNRKAINPYVEGIWGNWRVDTTYAYYGERAEKNPAVDVDTRSAGAIIGYKEFWNMGTSYITRNFAPEVTAVWPWNSTITQYNRKGYEIENKDPLERYNSGLYGYNKQLPVAVTNNARARETMFDGFEDYDYQTADCATCSIRRHANFGEINSSITMDQKHTGLRSLQINAGASLGFAAPVVSESSSSGNYRLRIKIDSVPKYDTVIVSQGTDKLSAWYTESGDPCPPTPVSAAQTIEYPFKEFDNHPRNVKWKGKIVPKESTTYQFRANCNDGFRIKINGSYITANTGYGTDNLSCNWNGGRVALLESNPINLIKGQMYDVEIDAYNGEDAGYFNGFMWKYGCNDYHTITEGCLYPDNYGTITVNRPTAPSFICTSLGDVKIAGNALTDSFSLIQGKQMVISAWVKEGGNDCKCSSYVKNSIAVTFTGATDNFNLIPAGNIIEGWQRYESVITIPALATAISIRLNNLASGSGGASVYFDDIRMHPFNANMKSFVYHASNLRLMAELDENNYASFYEYDDDGTLTRVKKETIAGIKTITETRSALQKSVD